MRRLNQVIGIVLTIILIFASVGPAAGAVFITDMSLSDISKTANKTLVVDGERDDDDEYATIQAAVDNATTGDRVEVRPGTYHESVRITKNIILIAPRGATLNGSTLPQEAEGIIIPPKSDSDSVVANFTITEFDGAVTIGGTQGNPVFRNITAVNNSIGVFASASIGNWTLQDSVLRNNRRAGILAPLSTGDWQIVDTVVQNNTFGGINTRETTGNWVILNTSIRDNGGPGAVYSPQSTGDWSILNSNILRNDRNGVVTTNSSGEWMIQGSNIQGNNDSGVVTSQTSSNWTIKNSNISINQIDGIRAYNTTGAWEVRQTIITTNSDAGINATGSVPAGNATQNYWGQSSGPSQRQCIGNVTCTPALSEPPTDGPSQDTLSAEVSLMPVIQTTTGGQTVTYGVVLSAADGGVGSYNFTLASANTSVAQFANVSLNGDPGVGETNISANGKTLSVNAALADTNNAGSVTLATVSVKAVNAGETSLSLSVAVVGNEQGNTYTIIEETSGTLNVTEKPAGPGDVTGNDNPATDPDGDGIFEDVNGDGSANVADVQSLFANLNSINSANRGFFDYNGDGNLNVADVQALFSELI